MAKLIMDVAIGLFRWILWSLASLAIQIINLMFLVVKQALSIDIFADYPFITVLYYGFVFIFFGYFIFFRIIRLALKYYVDEEFQMKLTMKPNIVFRRIIFSMIIIIAIPTIFSFLSMMTSSLVSNIGKFFNNGTTKELDVSTLFCSIGNVSKPMEVATCPDFLNPQAINETLADGSYKYFPDTFSILLPIFGAVMSIKVLLALVLSVTNRFLGIIFRMIIAPYSLSGFIEENNTAFATWTKLQISDIVMNFIQMVMVIIAFNFPVAIVLKGDIAFINSALRLAIFIGSLFAIIQAPGNLAQLIGSDASAVSAQGNLSNIKQSIATSLQTTGSIVKAAGAGAVVLTMNSFMNPSNLSATNSIAGGSNPITNAANNLYNNSLNYLQNSVSSMFKRR